jgi:hypothetical protein
MERYSTVGKYFVENFLHCLYYYREKTVFIVAIETKERDRHSRG